MQWQEKYKNHSPKLYKISTYLQFYAFQIILFEYLLGFCKNKS